MFFFELTPDGIVPWIGNIGKPLDHAERKQNHRI